MKSLSASVADSDATLSGIGEVDSPSGETTPPIGGEVTPPFTGETTPPFSGEVTSRFTGETTPPFTREFTPLESRCDGDGAASDASDNSKESLNNFPPPPDFLLVDSYHEDLEYPAENKFDDEPKAALNITENSPNTIENKETLTLPVDLGLQLNKQYVMNSSSQNHNKLIVRKSSTNYSLASSHTSQNSSPSSLGQYSPLVDDRPSPPSPCPASPAPPQMTGQSEQFYAPPQPITDEGLSKRNLNSQSEHLFGPSKPIAEEFSTNRNMTAQSEHLYGPPQPITDEGLAKRNLTVGQLVQSLQNKDTSIQNEMDISGSISEESSFHSAMSYNGSENVSSDGTVVAPFNTQYNLEDSSSVKFDPYTQPLPMSLHHENNVSQIPLPEQNGDMFNQSLKRVNSKGSTTTDEQLEQLKQKQKQLLHQQQLLREHQMKKQQQTQNLIAKPATKAFLNTLDSTLSKGPSPNQNKTINKTPVRSSSSFMSSKMSPRSVLAPTKQKTLKRSNSSSASSSRSGGLVSSIPQLNNSGNSPHSSATSSIRTPCDKGKFRQLISSASAKTSSFRESASHSLSTARSPRSVSVDNSGSPQLTESLLEQIRRGANLKKTKQVLDRSAPKMS